MATSDDLDKHDDESPGSETSTIGAVLRYHLLVVVVSCKYFRFGIGIKIFVKSESDSSTTVVYFFLIYRMERIPKCSGFLQLSPLKSLNNRLILLDLKSISATKKYRLDIANG